MRAKNKVIYGVARNDADFSITKTDENGKIKKLSSYRCWIAIIERCYSKKLHKRFPTYTDCDVVPEWLSYSAFNTWYNDQYKEDGWVIDKDILKQGNKIYGPDSCIFVSQQLNNFVNENERSRGDYKIGVVWQKHRNKFAAHCSNPFTKKLEYLGGFLTEDEAHEVWRKRKHEHACEWAKTVKDERLINALTSRFLPNKD